MGVQDDKCDFCSKDPPPGSKFSRCSSCQSVRYCSRECQKKHWKTHKVDCKKKRAAKDATCAAAAIVLAAYHAWWLRILEARSALRVHQASRLMRIERRVFPVRWATSTQALAVARSR